MKEIPVQFPPPADAISGISITSIRATPLCIPLQLQPPSFPQLQHDDHNGAIVTIATAATASKHHQNDICPQHSNLNYLTNAPSLYLVSYCHVSLTRAILLTTANTFD